MYKSQENFFKKSKNQTGVGWGGGWIRWALSVVSYSIVGRFNINTTPLPIEANVTHHLKNKYISIYTSGLKLYFLTKNKKSTDKKIRGSPFVELLSSTVRGPQYLLRYPFKQRDGWILRGIDSYKFLKYFENGVLPYYKIMLKTVRRVN